MLSGNGAVWRATQAIANDAVRPGPAGQMSKLFTDESQAKPRPMVGAALAAMMGWGCPIAACAAPTVFAVRLGCKRNKERNECFIDIGGRRGQRINER